LSCFLRLPLILRRRGFSGESPEFTLTSLTVEVSGDALAIAVVVGGGGLGALVVVGGGGLGALVVVGVGGLGALVVVDVGGGLVALTKSCKFPSWIDFSDSKKSVNCIIALKIGVGTASISDSAFKKSERDLTAAHTAGEDLSSPAASLDLTAWAAFVIISALFLSSKLFLF